MTQEDKKTAWAVGVTLLIVFIVMMASIYLGSIDYFGVFTR